jgi:hypothetical protein
LRLQMLLDTMDTNLQGYWHAAIGMAMIRLLND